MKTFVVFGLGALSGIALAAIGMNHLAAAQNAGAPALRGVKCPCPGDADCNGIVNFADISKVLENWNINCYPDFDGDGVPDSADNCPDIFNPDQLDTDFNGIGDACDIVNADNDLDGWSPPLDCNDNNAAINPAAPESCNGIDDDCDGTIDNNPVGGTAYWRDLDGDGFGSAGEMIFACSPPQGYVNNPIDCNDTNANINPAAPELCNGIDDNCNAQIDENCDGPAP